MTRRKFAALCGAAGAALLTAKSWLTERASPARVAAAVRGRMFPGKVRRLSKEEMAGPGPWRG